MKVASIFDPSITNQVVSYKYSDGTTIRCQSIKGPIGEVNLAQVVVPKIKVKKGIIAPMQIVLGLEYQIETDWIFDTPAGWEIFTILFSFMDRISAPKRTAFGIGLKGNDYLGFPLIENNLDAFAAKLLNIISYDETKITRWDNANTGAVIKTTDGTPTGTLTGPGIVEIKYPININDDIMKGVYPWPVATSSGNSQFFSYPYPIIIPLGSSVGTPYDDVPSTGYWNGAFMGATFVATINNSILPTEWELDLPSGKVFGGTVTLTSFSLYLIPYWHNRDGSLSEVSGSWQTKTITTDQIFSPILVPVEVSPAPYKLIYACVYNKNTSDYVALFQRKSEQKIGETDTQNPWSPPDNLSVQILNNGEYTISLSVVLNGNETKFWTSRVYDKNPPIPFTQCTDLKMYKINEDILVVFGVIYGQDSDQEQVNDFSSTKIRYGCLFKGNLTLSQEYQAIAALSDMDEDHAIHVWPNLNVNGQQAYGQGRIRATIREYHQLEA
jgi:hypothetical protein